MIKSVIGLVLGLAVGNTAMQAIPTISVAQAASCQIEFDQDATNLVAAQAFRYDVSVDSLAPITTPTTCSGTVSPFQCIIPLPNKTIGTHIVAITASEILTDGTVLSSSLSTSFSYRIANVPNAPKNLHIKK